MPFYLASLPINRYGDRVYSRCTYWSVILRYGRHSLALQGLLHENCCILCPLIQLYAMCCVCARSFREECEES